MPWRTYLPETSLPRLRSCCYRSEPQPHWNFCPRCGRPLRMPCPVCGGEAPVDLVHEGHSPWECNNGNRDLLKHCPDCGKLFKMDQHRCDQPSCRGRELSTPPSTWSDAHGGVQRRRQVSADNRSTRRRENQSIEVWPAAFRADIGDTPISAYGRLYLDCDPDVHSYRWGGAPVGAPFQAFPRGEPTGIVAHSGYVGVLGDAEAFLLEANEPIDVARFPSSANRQMIADDDWWLIGRDGIARLALRDAVQGDTPTVLAQGDFSDALPPVRLDGGLPWIIREDGHHFVVTPADDVVELPPLPQGEAPFGAFISGDRVAVLSNRPANAGGVVYIWETSSLLAGGPAMVLPLDFALLHTWCTFENTTYVCATSGDLIQPIRLDLPQFQADPLTLPASTRVREIVWLSASPGRILFLDSVGLFTLLDPDPSSREQTAWNGDWNGGAVKSWAVWGDAIVAVLEDADACRIVTIPRVERSDLP